MAAATRRLLPTLFQTLVGSGGGGGGGAKRWISTEKTVGAAAVVGSHTAKWMQDTSKKSPMELINEVPPIKIRTLPLAIQSSISALIWMHLLYANIVAFRYVQHHHH